MKYSNFYIENNDGKSNCIIRSFCKLYGKGYEEVFSRLCNIAKELNSSSFNDIEVFEKYMMDNNTFSIDCVNDVKIKDLFLDNGSYAIFCWDKNDFYHMVSVIDNVMYDKDERGLDLFVIKIYKINGEFYG